MSLPTTTPQWSISPKAGLSSLTFTPNASLPTLGPKDCLIELHAITLNYRDVALPTKRYPMAYKETVIPASDGAGRILAVGSEVTLHKPGDIVCTLFNQGHISGYMTPSIRKTSLGSHIDGVLRQYAVFPETGLVHAPKKFDMLRSGDVALVLKAGDWVLVQGTGGVSLFAAQFAVAMGANVIGTTSTREKGEALKKLGVEFVINYRENEEWGETARKLTPGEEGVHHVIEVGGEGTMAQSLKVIRYEGVISLIGFLGGKPGEQKTSFADCLKAICLVRGISVGSREQFVAMNEFIDEHDIRPVIDKRVFAFDEVPEAYQYMLDAKHWGKICIKGAGES